MSDNVSAIDDITSEFADKKTSMVRGELQIVHRKLVAINVGLYLLCGEKIISVGTVEVNASIKVKFVFSDEHVFNRFLRKPRLLDLGNAYIEGQVDLYGEMDAILDVCDQLEDCGQSVFETVRERVVSVFSVFRLFRTVMSSSREHYGLNSDLYQSFLDPYMQYTCGYFDSEECDLARAQVNKFNLIREWVGPLENKNHVDIGCGWGGLIAYFSAQFGTRSIGITDTPEQGWFATKNYNVNTLIGDFSALEKLSDSFDLVTVVGMLEHLTPDLQSTLFRLVAKKLEVGGSMYLQCIVKSPSWTGGDGSRFLQQHVFPGYFIDYPEKIESRLAMAGLEIVIKRDHSKHYGRTCKAWLDAVSKNKNYIVTLIGEKEYRVFYAYLAGATRVFSSGRGALHRYLVRRKRN